MHNNVSFLCMIISRWKNPGIDIYSIPGIWQPARISPGIDFSGNRSLGAPVITNTFLFGFGIIIFWKRCALLELAYSRIFNGIIQLKLLTESQNGVIDTCSPSKIRQ